MAEDDTTGYYKHFPDRTKEWVDRYVAPYPTLGADLTVDPLRSVTWDPSLIPVVERTKVLSERGKSLDAFFDDPNKDLLWFIERYAKDYPTDDNLKREGKRIWVRCPDPKHNDEHPSAHVTLNAGRDGLWQCKACDVGGDKWDFVAISHNISKHQLRQPGTTHFAELRETVALGNGWSWSSKPTVYDESEPVEAEAEPDPKDEAPVVPAAGAEPPPGLATVTSLTFADDREDGGGRSEVIRIPWEEIVPSGTFIHEYMRHTTVLDIPNEFLFWEAVMAVGLAAGRDCFMEASPNIYPTMYLILKSETGSGKSRSIRLIQEVLHDALPYDYSIPDSHGVLMAGEAGSGEVIISTYSREMTDPAGTGAMLKVKGMRALWTIDELSTLIARNSRGGSGTITQTLMSLHDAPTLMTHRLRSGDLIAEEPFGSVIAGTQPEVMRTFLSRYDAQSGFLNRWVHVEGYPKRRFAVQDMKVDLTGPANTLRSLQVWTRRGHVIELKRGGDGRRAWEEFFHAHVAPLQATGSPIYARLDLMMLKIMMILAINEHKTAIDSSIVERAVKLFPYLELTYSQTLDSISLSAEDRVAETIEKVLRKGPITRGRLKKALADAGHEWAKVTVVLRELERTGQVADVLYQNPKGGPKTSKLTWAEAV